MTKEKHFKGYQFSLENPTMTERNIYYKKLFRQKNQTQDPLKNLKENIGNNLKTKNVINFLKVIEKKGDS